jgi:hypothetical protein
MVATFPKTNASVSKTPAKFIPLTTTELGDKEDERIANFSKIEEERMKRLHYIKKARYMKQNRPTDLVEGILYDIEYLGHQLPCKPMFLNHNNGMNSQNHQHNF